MKQLVPYSIACRGMYTSLRINNSVMFSTLAQAKCPLIIMSFSNILMLPGSVSRAQRCFRQRNLIENVCIMQAGWILMHNECVFLAGVYTYVYKPFVLILVHYRSYNKCFLALSFDTVSSRFLDSAPSSCLRPSLKIFKSLLASLIHEAGQWGQWGWSECRYQLLDPIWILWSRNTFRRTLDWFLFQSDYHQLITGRGPFDAKFMG